MEVIHRYNGAYPFFLQHQTEQTYLQVLKENLTQVQIAFQKNRSKILKEIDHANLIKLVKIYREQSTLHILYEYFPISLDKYVEERSRSAKNNQKQCIRQLVEHFNNTIDRIIDIFVEKQIKTDISIHSLVVSSLEEGVIKLFIDPSAEFHSLTRQNHELTQSEEILEFKLYLSDFYKSQKKRLNIDFEELLQKYFGKTYKVNEPNHPNFVISGSKLVFINQAHSNARQHKNHNMAELSNEKQHIAQGKSALRNSPNKVDKTEEIKRELKQKNMKKIEEIKSVLNRFQNKTPNFNQQAEDKLTPHKPQQLHHNNHDHYHLYPQEQSPKKQRSHNQQHHSHHENARIQPHAVGIANNHQVQNVDSIIFKQVNSDKIQKNNSHKDIEPSQNQHQKIEELRQPKQVKGNKVKRVSTLKEENSQMNAPTHEIERKSNDSNRQIEITIVPNNSKSNLTEEHPKQNEEKQQEKKEEKHNKYKMKITTSHQFQIEGTGEPQIKQIEKDILEGIKSGRITLSEFPDGSNAYKIETTEIHEVTQPVNAEKTNSHSESNHSATKSGEGNTSHKKLNDNSCSINLKTNSYQQLSSSSHYQEQKESSQHSTSIKQAFQNDHSSQTITQKIRQAKSKAEHALKQYAKRKANEQ